MKTKVLLLLCCLCFALTSATAKEKAIEYTIESAGSAVHGTYLVKVWVFSKSSSVSDDELIYGAIHGVIFRGFAGSQGQATQRPMVANSSIETEKSDYFGAFFGKEAAYRRYGSIVTGSYQRVKTPKGYKVAAIVQVSKDNLRKELEQAGIVKSLSAGF